MDINKYNKCIEFLINKNCNNISHSHSNFLNHLIGTFNILKKWKQSEDLCYAGMFHNVYGNKYFNPNLNVTREEIKNLIGEKAENLVHKFVNCERENINDGDDVELILLNLANYLDQK
jgi:(p)ppGpp synthase/HD superfamily hydrolase